VYYFWSDVNCGVIVRGGLIEVFKKGLMGCECVSLGIEVCEGFVWC
jgi:hypothetical protein